MAERGYPPEFAEALYRQIEGFGEYGFPESHAASFALLVYVSAWLKRHEPAAFLVGLLNSQPMGFYAPSQLIQDAVRHGVEVRAVDVVASDWSSTLEGEAVRLGLRLVRGLGQAAGERIVAARRQRAFRDVAHVAARAATARDELEALAAAGALASLAGHRHAAAWAAAGIDSRRDFVAAAPPAEAAVELPAPGEGENLVADYASLGFSLGRHPLALLRGRLDPRYASARRLRELPHRALARCVGLVTCRQRPGTASGVVFLTLEDETGMANVIVHPGLAERQRRELLGARLLGVLGVLQREGEVVHLLAKRLVDHSPLLGRLSVASRDFC
jgi:error-prone DNA polymerase